MEGGRPSIVPHAGLGIPEPLLRWVAGLSDVGRRPQPLDVRSPRLCDPLSHGMRGPLSGNWCHTDQNRSSWQRDENHGSETWDIGKIFEIDRRPSLLGRGLVGEACQAPRHQRSVSDLVSLKIHCCKWDIGSRYLRGIEPMLVVMTLEQRSDMYAWFHRRKRCRERARALDRRVSMCIVIPLGSCDAGLRSSHRCVAGRRPPPRRRWHRQ